VLNREGAAFVDRFDKAFRKRCDQPPEHARREERPAVEGVVRQQKHDVDTAGGEFAYVGGGLVAHFAEVLFQAFYVLGHARDKRIHLLTAGDALSAGEARGEHILVTDHLADERHGFNLGVYRKPVDAGDDSPVQFLGDLNPEAGVADQFIAALVFRDVLEHLPPNDLFADELRRELELELHVRRRTFVRLEGECGGCYLFGSHNFE